MKAKIYLSSSRGPIFFHLQVADVAVCGDTVFKSMTKSRT